MKNHRLLSSIAVGATLLVGASAFAQEKQPQAPEVDLDEMVELEGDEFVMGTSTDEEVGDYGDRWFVNEQPDHPVVVDDFHLDKFEVTVEEFALFLTYAGGDRHWHRDQFIDPVADGYLAAEGAANEPVRNVTWQAADDYCKWAGKRLPTEAEWEYAAAGTERREFPWGDDGRGCEAVNYFAGGTFCEEGVVDVGERPDGATPDGIHNMSGNVAEWVADWYGDYPEDGEILDNPTGPETGELKVVRGGGHLSSGRWRRSRARHGAEPKRRSDNIGFRCAYDSEPTDGALRGALRLPADEDRRHIERPQEPPAPAPAVVTENLRRPGSILAAAGQWYVLERGHGNVVEIDVEDWSTSSLVDDLNDPVDMATDGAMLFVTDQGSQQVLQIDPSSGATSVIADDQVDPYGIAADENGVVWATEDTVYYYDVGDEELQQWSGNFAAPSDLTVAGDEIYFTSDDGNEQSALYRVSISAGTAPEALFDVDALLGDGAGGGFRLEHVYLESEGDHPWFIVRYRGFPNNGLLFVYDPSEGASYQTYTPPPRGIHMQVIDAKMYMSAGNSVIAFDARETGTFHELTPWTRPGGLFATEDYVLWSDQQNGRVYFEEVE